MERRTLLGPLLWAAQRVRLVRSLLRTPRVVVLVVLTHSELAPPERSALSDQAKPSARHPLLPQHAGNPHATAPCNRADSCGKQKEWPSSDGAGVGVGWWRCLPDDRQLPTCPPSGPQAVKRACPPPAAQVETAPADGEKPPRPTRAQSNEEKQTPNPGHTYCVLYTTCGRLSVDRKGRDQRKRSHHDNAGERRDPRRGR